MISIEHWSDGPLPLAFSSYHHSSRPGSLFRFNEVSICKSFLTCKINYKILQSQLNVSTAIFNLHIIGHAFLRGGGGCYKRS